MKQFLTTLRMFASPVFIQLGIAIVMACTLISGVLCGRNAQAISSSDAAHKFVLLEGAPVLFPADQSTMVNPDVQLKLTFKDTPRVGTSGKIRIYDAASDQLVETLDMSIPAGPTKPVDPAVRAKNYLAFPYPYARTSRPTNANTKPGTPSAGAVPTSNEYQLTIIGGFTDGFHFYPITVNGNTATIHPHHDLLSMARPIMSRLTRKCSALRTMVSKASPASFGASVPNQSRRLLVQIARS